MRLEQGLPTKSKEYTRLAAVCAACGFLIVPSICALGLLIPPTRWALRNRLKGRLALICGIFLLTILTPLPTLYAGYYTLQHFMLRYRLGAHTSLLSAQIHRYYGEYQRLPMTFEELRRSNPDALRAYADKGNDRRVEVLYKPVADWDEKTPFVVAVTVLSGRKQDSLRAYVILGDWGVAHFASNGDLQWILKVDNALRRSVGQEQLWEESNCRMWPGDDWQ